MEWVETNPSPTNPYRPFPGGAVPLEGCITNVKEMDLMKIALIQEFSQASKNDIILGQLKKVAEPLGNTVYNTGMQQVDNPNDRPEDYTEENPRLTYLHIGIQAALLLNSKAVDFVVTGCGTGQGALMSCNMYPGVVCGYCIEPTDAYLFLQINDGNALSIPYAKGFGWGAELNLENIFTRAFGSPKGQGYPADRKESQNKNVKLLDDVKTHSRALRHPRARPRDGQDRPHSGVPGLLLRQLPGQGARGARPRVRRVNVRERVV